MSDFSRTFLMIMLLGCHDLQGNWEGICAGDEGDIGVSLSIASDIAGEVDGDAVASFQIGGGEVEADLVLEGTREGPDFSIELDSAGWAMSLDGMHQGGVMEGECLLAITVLGSTVIGQGDFSLEPVE